VTARIITTSTARTLRAAASALFRQGTDWAVYRIAGGRAWIRKVKVGRRNEDVAGVLGGLSRDDVVVTCPGDRPADGVRVAERAGKQDREPRPAGAGALRAANLDLHGFGFIGRHAPSVGNPLGGGVLA
jgi:hypothetical protein